MAKVPDIHKRLAAHIEATRKRDEWVRKGIAYEKAGKVMKAKEALKHAEKWEFERRKLKA